MIRSKQKGYYISIILLIYPLFAQSQNISDSIYSMKSWDIKKIDLARNVPYASSDQADILLEVNMVRTNPKLYAELFLEPMLIHFRGKIYKGMFETEEGAKAVIECINVLKGTKKLKPLKLNKELTDKALYHSSKQGKTGKTGHTSPNGVTFESRMNSFIKGGCYTGEVISYGYDNPRDIVIQLLIDDGVFSRGHRKLILTKNFTDAGIGLDKHIMYGHMCTIDFAFCPEKKNKKKILRLFKPNVR